MEVGGLGIDNHSVSIIIPVYNGIDFTRQCLENIFLNTFQPVEIIVLNNASTDHTCTLLKLLENKLRVISNEKNVGFARACNQGGQIAQGDYLVFLNNDTIVTANWLTPLLNCFSTVKQVGMVTPQLRYPYSNIIQYAGVAFHPNGLPAIVHYRESATDPRVNLRREMPAVGGACMVIPRPLFEFSGLFDEHYLNGLEDIDLSLRLRKAGYRTLLCPESVVFHYESKSEGRSAHNEGNIRYYLQKWQHQFKVTATGDIEFL